MWGSFDEKVLKTFREEYAERQAMALGYPMPEFADKDNMPCNKPRRTPDHPDKKSIVKACENGQEKIIRFGDQHMKIRKNEPERRKNFRARHKCDQDNTKLSARYWSCKAW